MVGGEHARDLLERFGDGLRLKVARADVARREGEGVGRTPSSRRHRLLRRDDDRLARLAGRGLLAHCFARRVVAAGGLARHEQRVAKVNSTSAPLARVHALAHGEVDQGEGAPLLLGQVVVRPADVALVADVRVGVGIDLHEVSGGCRCRPWLADCRGARRKSAFRGGTQPDKATLQKSVLLVGNRSPNRGLKGLAPLRPRPRTLRSQTSQTGTPYDVTEMPVTNP